MKKTLTFIIFPLLIVLTNCSKTTIATEPQSYEIPAKNANDKTTGDVAENSANAIKADVIQKIKQNIINFTIEYTFSLDNGEISIYRFFDENSIEYEGGAQINIINGLYEIQFNDFAKNYEDASFVVHSFSGGYSNDIPKKLFYAIFGIINDSQIAEIDIYFNDGSLASVIVGDRTMYAYSRTDKIISIQKIIALDKGGNAIYQYPPYPPKKLN